MAGNYRKHGYAGKPASQIAEIANGLIDPILAKKAGINTMIIGVWDEIVGPEFEQCSRPEKIIWPRQRSLRGSASSAQSDPESGGGLEPGQLTIACEGSRALFLSHQQSEIISRINAFFGFPAINRIKIVQKAIQKHDKIRKKPRKLQKNERQELNGMLDGMEDDNLKQALTKLGEAVLSKRQN